MSYTEQDIAVMDKWESRLKTQGIVFSRKHPGNFGLVTGFIDNQLDGKITEANLDAAAKATFAGLKFEPGFEMADPQLEKDNRRRQQELRDREGMSHHKTEFDRPDERRQKREKDANDAAAAEEFNRRQQLAEIEFRNICDSYLKVHPSGRTDHSISQERRALLRGIVVKRRGHDGKEVFLFDEMLRLAQEALKGFEREDARSNR